MLPNDDKTRAYCHRLETEIRNQDQRFWKLNKESNLLAMDSEAYLDNRQECYKAIGKIHALEWALKVARGEA